MKPNFYQSIIQINHQIDENTSRAFTMNDVAIELLAVFPE